MTTILNDRRYRLALIEDALEAIRDGYTREEFKMFHKRHFQAEALKGFDAERRLQRYMGSPRKALNCVRAAIQTV